MRLDVGPDFLVLDRGDALAERFLLPDVVPRDPGFDVTVSGALPKQPWRTLRSRPFRQPESGLPGCGIRFPGLSRLFAA